MIKYCTYIASCYEHKHWKMTNCSKIYESHEYEIESSIKLHMINQISKITSTVSYSNKAESSYSYVVKI